MFIKPNIVFLYFLSNQTEVEKKKSTFSGIFPIHVVDVLLAVYHCRGSRLLRNRRPEKLVENSISGFRNICRVRVSANVGLVPARSVYVSMFFRLTATFGVHFITELLISAHFSESHHDF